MTPRKLSALALALLLLGAASAQKAFAHSGHKHEKDEPQINLPDIVAKVGDVNIPKTAIWPELKKTVALYSEKGAPLTAEQEKTTVQQLVEREIGQTLLLQKARKLGLGASEEEVEKKIQSAKAKFKSEDEFDKKLAERGLTPESYREQVRSDLMIDKLLLQEIGSRVKIGQDEIEAYYRSNSEQFISEEKYQVSVILIKSKDSDPDNAQKAAIEKLDSIRKQIKAGADFSDLAKRFSQDSLKPRGGDMGLVSSKHLLPLFREKADKLKEGETSDIFKSEHGFHLLKLVKKEGGKVTSIEEAREKITSALKEKKIQEQAKSYVGELRKEADVKTYY